MQDEVERQACCDENVISAAGREFCFYDVIHPEGTFDNCDSENVIELFDCCTDLAQGNQSLEFDCQTELTGSGADGEDCETQEECYENFNKAKEAVEKAEVAALANQDDDDDDDSASAAITITIVVLCTVGVIAFALVSCRTRCFKQPFFPKRDATPKLDAAAEKEKADCPENYMTNIQSKSARRKKRKQSVVAMN